MIKSATDFGSSTLTPNAMVPLKLQYFHTINNLLINLLRSQILLLLAVTIGGTAVFV